MGGRLTQALTRGGIKVRALVRDRDKAAGLESDDVELHEGDVLSADSLRGAGEGMDVAYYLVHGMGRGSDADFAKREREAARNFAHLASDEGVARVVYLGGLGSNPTSQHLRSRHETAEILAEHGPPLTYVRAAMVVGAESESFKTLRYLVARLPVMVAPKWLETPTQPVGVDDAVAYLAGAPDVPASEGREVQIGGPEVVTYGEMLDRMAVAMDKRPRPKLKVPLLSPGLSSHWIGLVTPVDAGVARPLVEGLTTETVVTDRSGAELFDIQPTGLDETLRRALAEEPD